MSAPTGPAWDALLASTRTNEHGAQLYRAAYEAGRYDGRMGDERVPLDDFSGPTVRTVPVEQWDQLRRIRAAAIALSRAVEAPDLPAAARVHLLRLRAEIGAESVEGGEE